MWTMKYRAPRGVHSDFGFQMINESGIPPDYSIRALSAEEKFRGTGPHEPHRICQYLCGLRGALTCLGDLLPRCWYEKAAGTTDVTGQKRWDFTPSPTIQIKLFKSEKGLHSSPSVCTFVGRVRG